MDFSTSVGRVCGALEGWKLQSWPTHVLAHGAGASRADIERPKRDACIQLHCERCVGSDVACNAVVGLDGWVILGKVDVLCEAVELRVSPSYGAHEGKEASRNSSKQSYSPSEAFAESPE